MVAQRVGSREAARGNQVVVDLAIQKGRAPNPLQAPSSKEELPFLAKVE